MGGYVSVPGASKEIKVGSTSWTSDFVTANAAYTDITNGTVTVTGLNAAKTYDIVAHASGGALNNSIASGTNFALVIDGTRVSTTSDSNQPNGYFVPAAMTGKKQVTGATQYTVKVQLASTGGNAALYNGVGLDCISHLVMTVIEV